MTSSIIGPEIIFSLLVDRTISLGDYIIGLLNHFAVLKVFKFCIHAPSIG